MLETIEYRQTAASLGRRGVSQWLGRWWWAAVLPACPLAYASMRDYRFLIVLFALLFIAYPAILMFVFYNYALSPALARNILPHKVVLDDDSLYVAYYKKAKAAEGEEEEETEDDDEPVVRRIPYDKIKKVEDAGSAIIIFLGKLDWIEIPLSALPPGKVDEALALLGVADAPAPR